MALSVDGLPRELLAHIYSFLRPHDLAQIASVSKNLGILAESLIWNEIELHTSSYHESSRELKEPPPVVSAQNRRYHGGSSGSSHNERKAASLFWMLEITAKNDLARAKQLLSRVRKLCTVLDWMNCPEWVPRPPQVSVPSKLEFTWNIFPLLSNLESLELHGQWEPYWDGQGRGFDGSVAPLPALRYVKLFGYLPSNFVRYILQSAPTLERLELGVLDAPVGCNAGDDREYPLEWKSRSEDNDDDDLSSNEDSDDEDSLDGEEIAPRPLPIFIDGKVPAFPLLKHLHLCKPSESDPVRNESMDRDVTYSKRAENASLMDWSGLLRAVQGTVETLVLEHRVTAEYIENDGLSERDFIIGCSGGPADQHFMETIVPVFKEKAFARLRNVYMRGILVGACDESTEYRQWFRNFWEEYGVECSFSYGNWCFFDAGPGATYWASYDGDSSDEDDEEFPNGPED